MSVTDPKATSLVVVPPNYDRRQYLGGSDVAAILGLSNWRTALDVYRAKTSDSPEEMDPTRKLFLERRKRWEPVVIQMLKEELDAKITNVNVRYQSAQVPYFAAEIDAEAEEEGEPINVEIKTVSPFSFGERYGWGEPGSNDVPIDYECQVMHGLGVTQRRKAVLVAMVGLDQMHFYPIIRDDSTLAKMWMRLEQFWQENVVAKKEPEPTRMSDVDKLYRSSNALEVLADGELASKALRLRAIHAQIGALELEGEHLEFEVKRHMRDNEALVVEGKKIITWKEQGWTRVDYEALKRDRLYSKYTRSGTQRVFKTLKG